MKVLLNNIYTTTEEDVETGTCDLCLSYDDWDVAVFSFTFEGRNYDIEGWCKGCKLFTILVAYRTNR